MAITSVGTCGTAGTSGTGTSFTLTTATNALSNSGDIGILEVVTDNISTADGNTNDHTSVTGGNGVWTKIYEQTNTVGGAAGDGVCVSLWKFRSTGANATGTVFTINHGSTGDRCASMWKFTVGAGNDLANALTPHGYTTDGANGFGSNTISGLSSLSRLYVAAYGKEANSTTALTPSTSFTELTGTRSRNNANAVLVRGEFRINTSTGETANPTLAVSGDNAMIFAALFEIVLLTQTAADDANNLADALAKVAGIPKSFSDDANNLADALVKVLEQRWTTSDDTNTLTDYFTYGRRPRWRDALAKTLADVGGALSLSLSDDINLLADALAKTGGIPKSFSDDVNNVSDSLAQNLAGPRITFLEPGGASTGGLELWSSHNLTPGAVSVDTDVKPGGAYSSIKLFSASGSAIDVRAGGILAETSRISIYFRASNVTSQQVCTIRTSGGGVIGGISTDSSGKLVWVDGNLNPSSAGPTALQADTFCRISFGSNLIGADNLSVKAYLNGGLELNLTGQSTNGRTGADQLRLLCQGTNQSQYYAHVYVDSGSGLTDPGAGYAYAPAVTAKFPTSTSDNNWDTTLGSGAVNERPLSETNGVESAASNGTYQDYNLQSLSAGDVNLTGLPILGRMAWVWAKESSASGSPAIVDNGSATPITLTTSPAIYRHAVADTVYPPAANSIGMISGTDATFLYECGVVVAFVPPIPVEASDALSLTDSATVVLGINLTFSESVNNLSDAETHILGQLEVFNETLTLSDSLALGHGLLCADSYTLTDALVVQLAYLLAFNETLSLTDSEAHQLGQLQTSTDSLTPLTDSLVLGYGLLFTDDSFNLADAFAKLLVSSVIELDLSDSLTLDDSLALGYGLLTADSISLTDSRSIELGQLVDFSNSLVLTDAARLELIHLLALTDNVNFFADAVDTSAPQGPLREVGITDALAALSDAVVLRLAYLLALTDDANSLSDSTALVEGLLTTFSDSLALTDSEAAALGYNLPLTDSLTLTDSIQLRLGVQLTLSDTVTLTDSTALALGYQVSLSDNAANWADSVAKTLGLTAIIADNLQPLTDSISFFSAGRVQLSDTLTLTDSLNKSGEGFLGLADSIAIDDSAAVELRGPDFNESLADTLVLTDAIVLNLGNELQLQLALTDTITLSDHYFQIRYPHATSAKRHIVVPSAPRGVTVTANRGIKVPVSSRTATPPRRTGIIVPPDERTTKVE